GCPVVSTDCPHGPAEILENGRYGPLVPVGDVEGLARALMEDLDSPPPRELLQGRAMEFSVERSCRMYLRTMLSGWGHDEASSRRAGGAGDPGTGRRRRRARPTAGARRARADPGGRTPRAAGCVRRGEASGCAGPRD